MRIAIIGTGNVGSALAENWARAGHEMVLSSRHPEQLKSLAVKLGDSAITGSPHQAAISAQVVLLAVPLKGIRELADSIRLPLKGKVVLNACNAIEERDGDIAREVIRSGQGTGLWMTSLFPGSRMVRAFNTVPAANLRTDAHRRENPIGVPVASDDVGALEIASLLIHDAGFEPVVVGGLRQASVFEPGTAYWGRAIPSVDLAEALAVRRAA